MKNETLTERLARLDAKEEAMRIRVEAIKEKRMMEIENGQRSGKSFTDRVLSSTY